MEWEAMGGNRMKLGQKVKYKQIVRKRSCEYEDYIEIDDFEDDDDKKILKRVDIVDLEKERIGFVAGRRKIVFETIFELDIYPGDYDGEREESIEIAEQKYKQVYLVAYDMGKTNYVLEKDLEEINGNN